MLLLSSMVVLLSGEGLATMWGQLPFFQIEVDVFYVLIVMALWHAPLYAWLLLVSGWARRATFLWVVFPPAAISIFEWIAFHTTHFGHLLGYRLYGFVAAAFALKMPDGTSIDPHFVPPAQFTPGKFLISPGLWLGLIFAAAFLAAAVRMRRYREPI
jgi:ABC-2 type transport system permease protein